mmetsp:Transcript_54660/g.108746  ORF Transcript_54660/g.108746 Transcript_54660/m.108746 type:complete len:97 (+) Transcript_54660:1127-1417(+)
MVRWVYQTLKSVPKAKRPKLKCATPEDDYDMEPLQPTEPARSCDVFDSSHANTIRNSTKGWASEESAFDVVQRSFIPIPIPNEDEESSDQQTARTI